MSTHTGPSAPVHPPPRSVSLPTGVSSSSLPPVTEEPEPSASYPPGLKFLPIPSEVSLEPKNDLEKSKGFAVPTLEKGDPSPFASKEVSPTATIFEGAVPAPSNSRAAKRRSMFGDIPTETFGPTDMYMFEDPPEEPGEPPRAAERKVTRLARRIHGWSWQAYPIGMGTSAVYVTMSGLRDRSPTLRTVETIFFFLNVIIFLINLTTLALQAILYPRQAKRLVTDSTKNIFIPLVVLSFATIIIGIINYGVTPGILEEELIYGLFWVYVVLAVGVCFPLLMIWFNQKHDITKFTPAWMFLIFPMMLVGVVAFNTLRTMQPSDPRSLGVLFVGYFFQGIGTFVTMFYICIYFLRIMMTGFMDGHQANGAFVAVGPPGFTALALINLGSHARNILPQHGIISDTAGEVWYAASVLSALLLFGLAIFLVLFGAFPYWFKLHKHLNEILGCWALTFPNVGWISCFGALGNTLNIPGFFDIQVVFVIVMACIWVVLVAFTAVAFKRGLILNAKAEDVLEDTQEKWQAKEMV